LSPVLRPLALFLYRTSRPHMAVVGLVPRPEHVRSVIRHKVRTSPKVLTLRVDESLYFANVRYQEDRLFDMANRPAAPSPRSSATPPAPRAAGGSRRLRRRALPHRDRTVGVHPCGVDGRKIDRPSSNGCIGLFNEHVVGIYERAKVGTPVVLN
jgi:hypothetical protein